MLTRLRTKWIVLNRSAAGGGCSSPDRIPRGCPARSCRVDRGRGSEIPAISSFAYRARGTRRSQRLDRMRRIFRTHSSLQKRRSFCCGIGRSAPIRVGCCICAAGYTCCAIAGTSQSRSRIWLTKGRLRQPSIWRMRILAGLWRPRIRRPPICDRILQHCTRGQARGDGGKVQSGARPGTLVPVSARARRLSNCRYQRSRSRLGVRGA